MQNNFKNSFRVMRIIKVDKVKDFEDNGIIKAENFTKYEV